jgi:hypothetical protein
VSRPPTQNIIVEVFGQNARPQQTIQCLAPEELRREIQGSLDIAQTHQNHGLDRQADGHRALIQILRRHLVNTLDQPQFIHHRGYQPQMINAFYGVRTGFIRRGGVSFFAWLGQLAGVVVSFQERCILDDWGAECRFQLGAVPSLSAPNEFARYHLTSKPANALRSSAHPIVLFKLPGARTMFLPFASPAGIWPGVWQRGQPGLPVDRLHGRIP